MMLSNIAGVSVLAKNLIWLSLSQGCSIIGGFLFFALAARQLGIEEFTDLLIISGTASLTFSAVTGAVAFRIVRDHASASEQWSKTELRNQLVNLARWSLPLAAISVFACTVLRGVEVFVPAVLWSGNQLFTMGLAAVVARYAANDQMGWSAVTGLCFAVLANGLLLLEAPWSGSLKSVTAAACSAQFIVTVSTLTVVARRLEKLNGDRSDGPTAASMRRQSDLVPTALASALLQGRTRLDYVFLSSAHAPSVAGAYTSLLRLFDYIRMLPILLINASNPSLSRTWLSASQAAINRMRYYLLAFTLLGFAVTLVLKGIGVVGVALLFNLDRAIVADQFAIVALAIPLDMIAWHAQWGLFVARRSGYAVLVQVMGSGAHIGVALWLLSGDTNYIYGYAFLCAVAMSAVLGQALFYRCTRDRMMFLLSLLLSPVALAVSELPTQTQLSASGSWSVVCSMPICVLAILLFLMPEKMNRTLLTSNGSIESWLATVSGIKGRSR